MKDKMKISTVDQGLFAETSVERRYQSQQLFCGQQEVLIEHAGDAYRLRITRQGKLILTK